MPGLLLLILLLTSNQAVADEPLPSIVAQRVAMPLEYRLDGVVEARRQATLSAEVAGKIESVNFDVDDYVEQGEVVLVIRDREYRARRQQAGAAVDEAGANLQDMQLEFERNQGLRRKKLVSQALFDKAAVNLKAAQARLAAAEARLEQAQELLGHTRVRAPYSGVVVERHIEAGEAVKPGQAIMTGYAVGQLRISVKVPQSVIGGLRRERAATVILLEDASRIEVGKITIHPFANPLNHSFPVRLELLQNDPRLYPGMLVKVALAIGKRERLLVPQTSLVSRSEVNAVYVLAQDGRISMRQVRPGNLYGERIEILAGLDPGERVALDPVRAGIKHKRQSAVRP